MKHIPTKYLAGLIDGEGCIDVQLRPRAGEVRPRMRIAMVDYAGYLLERCHNTYGGHFSYRTGSGTHRDSICWEVVGYKQCCKLLRQIVNHLILKREQARFCLWMETEIKGRHVGPEVRNALREELKLMKRDPHRLSERAQKNISAML